MQKSGFYVIKVLVYHFRTQGRVATMLKKLSLSKRTQRTINEERAYTSVYKSERVLKNETDIKSVGQKYVAQLRLPE